MTKQTTAGAPARAPSPVLIGWLLVGQWRAQPGRLATAVLAIAIGVALSLAIELVNRSALSEFGDALAIVNGQAQASIAARSNGMAESVYEAVLADPAIAALVLRSAPVPAPSADAAAGLCSSRTKLRNLWATRVH